MRQSKSRPVPCLRQRLRRRRKLLRPHEALTIPLHSTSYEPPHFPLSFFPCSGRRHSQVRSSHACPPVMCTINRISVWTAIHILVGAYDPHRSGVDPTNLPRKDPSALKEPSI